MSNFTFFIIVLMVALSTSIQSFPVEERISYPPIPTVSWNDIFKVKSHVYLHFKSNLCQKKCFILLCLVRKVSAVLLTNFPSKFAYSKMYLCNDYAVQNWTKSSHILFQISIFWAFFLQKIPPAKFFMSYSI